jgi:hypothetical protein
MCYTYIHPDVRKMVMFCVCTYILIIYPYPYQT